MLFLDLLLLIMIIVCVVYCWMLNKRIQDLQNSRIEFARMIKELNASIIKAENNVNEMSELSKVTSNEIKAVVEEAKTAAGELASMSELAAELSAKLYSQTQETDFSAAEDNFKNLFSAKPQEKFTEEDLAPVEDEEYDNKYTNHLKSFINTIVNRKPDRPAMSLSQTSYYNTLRKINAKK